MFHVLVIAVECIRCMVFERVRNVAWLVLLDSSAVGAIRTSPVHGSRQLRIACLLIDYAVVLKLCYWNANQPVLTESNGSNMHQYPYLNSATLRASRGGGEKQPLLSTLDCTLNRHTYRGKNIYKSGSSRLQAMCELSFVQIRQQPSHVIHNFILVRLYNNLISSIDGYKKIEMQE